MLKQKFREIAQMMEFEYVIQIKSKLKPEVVETGTGKQTLASTLMSKFVLDDISSVDGTYSSGPVFSKSTRGPLRWLRWIRSCIYIRPSNFIEVDLKEIK